MDINIYEMEDNLRIGFLKIKLKAVKRGLLSSFDNIVVDDIIASLDMLSNIRVSSIYNKM